VTIIILTDSECQQSDSDTGEQRRPANNYLSIPTNHHLSTQLPVHSDQSSSLYSTICHVGRDDSQQITTNAPLSARNSLRYRYDCVYERARCSANCCVRPARRGAARRLGSGQAAGALRGNDSARELCDCTGSQPSHAAM